MAAAYEYDAFISYSHQHDAVLGPALQTNLQRFAKPWYRMRALRIFLDSADLSANPALWASIEDGLRSARWFILLASADAARSGWVDREVQWWITNRSSGQMLIVGTDLGLAWDEQKRSWAVDAPVPPALHGAFTAEPLWVDLSDVQLNGHRITQSHMAQSEQLAAEATNFSATNAPLAMLLSMAAYDRAPTAEARTAVIRAGKQPLDRLLTVGTSPVTAVSYSTDGKDLAAGDADGHVITWNTETWRHDRLALGNSEITAVAISPDQHYLVAGNDAGALGVWDTRTGKAQISRGKGSNSIRCLAFSPGGNFFAVGFSDGTVLLACEATGHSVNLSEGYPIDQPVTSIAFSPDGKTLAVGGYSDLIRLWSISADSEIANLAEDSPVDSIAFNRAGNTLAAGTGDGTVGVWNVGSRTQTATSGEGSPVTTVAYSPDGTTLAAADASGHVGLWDSTLGKASTFSDGDSSPVTNVTFSRTGRASPPGIWRATLGCGTRQAGAASPASMKLWRCTASRSALAAESSPSGTC